MNPQEPVREAERIPVEEPKVPECDLWGIAHFDGSWKGSFWMNEYYARKAVADYAGLRPILFRLRDSAAPDERPGVCIKCDGPQYIPQDRFAEGWIACQEAAVKLVEAEWNAREMQSAVNVTFKIRSLTPHTAASEGKCLHDKGAYRSPNRHDNFYCNLCHAGMGNEYWEAHKNDPSTTPLPTEAEVVEGMANIVATFHKRGVGKIEVAKAILAYLKSLVVKFGDGR